ncbi:aldehyde dehydrogenase [Candidatus Nomurabacteria bacterium]|nr:aldehyde dehydrogenase [Candidatus Nomurabacteria bacterium]
MNITSINPSTGQNIGEVTSSSQGEVKVKVQKARKALKKWRALGVTGRVEILRNVVKGFEKRQEEFAELIAKEMGMPISQSHHDVGGAIDYFNWYLDNAEKYLSPEVVHDDESMTHTVYYEPVGVVAAITPWNFPASNFVWMVGQNLVIGNTVVFKDSEEVPLCGKLIEEVFAESNTPEGVFLEVYGDREIGNTLVHEDIDMICFTGSTAVGQQLYRIGAEKFIKVFLELGGSAPGIVFEDADLDKVLDTIYANRFDNSGQICDGLKRLIVQESRLNEVIERLKSKLEQVTIGDASNKDTDIGPLVSKKQLNVLQRQVEDSLTKGARIEYSKEIGNLNGFFYPPTILTQITREMPVWNEETFGPVLPIVTFKTQAEAIELANDTKYGLGGYVFTEDKSKFRDVALEIDSGMIQVNNTSYVTPSSPFGGYKVSGIGREHGKFGFHELSQIKLISEEN